jgi:hypothetical protein
MFLHEISNQNPCCPATSSTFSEQVALLLDTAALLSQRHVSVAKLSLESV